MIHFFLFLKRILCRLLVRTGLSHPVQVYYGCFEKLGYLTVSIKKSTLGAQLEIGNAFVLPKEWGNDAGTIFTSGGLMYGYVTFDYGFMLFPSAGDPLSSKFGFQLWKSKRQFSNTYVSSSCTYIHMGQGNLEEKIKLLKYGEKK